MSHPLVCHIFKIVFIRSQKSQTKLFLSLPKSKCRTSTFATCQNFCSKIPPENNSLFPNVAPLLWPYVRN